MTVSLLAAELLMLWPPSRICAAARAVLVWLWNVYRDRGNQDVVTPTVTSVLVSDTKMASKLSWRGRMPVWGKKSTKFVTGAEIRWGQRPDRGHAVDICIAVDTWGAFQTQRGESRGTPLGWPSSACFRGGSYLTEPHIRERALRDKRGLFPLQEVWGNNHCFLLFSGKVKHQ